MFQIDHNLILKKHLRLADEQFDTGAVFLIKWIHFIDLVPLCLHPAGGCFTDLPVIIQDKIGSVCSKKIQDDQVPYFIRSPSDGKQVSGNQSCDML